MDYPTFGKVTELAFEELKKLNGDETLPISDQGAILVIEDVPSMCPSGPCLDTWHSHLLLDQDGNVVARSPSGHAEIKVTLKFGHQTEEDWNRAKEAAIFFKVWSSSKGTRMGGETEAGRRFNELAESADDILSEA